MSRPRHDVVVIGGGLFGLVFARQIAEHTRARVLVAETTGHLGGLACSRRDPVTGVEYNPHGTHVLATADRRVLGYLTQLGGWLPYRHTVFAQAGRDLVPMPVGLEAISACYGRPLNPAQARALVERDAAAYRNQPVRSAADAARAVLGLPLYQMFVAGHIAKQWGTPPEHLAPEVFSSRFQVRYGTASTYFAPGAWQGLPAGGYSALCAALASHERIEVELGRHAHPLPRFRHLCLVTSPIDAFFGYRFGRLERRTITIDWAHLPVADAPAAAVITYPDPAIWYYRTHVPARLPWNAATTHATVLVGFERAGTGEHSVSFVVRSAANAVLAERYRRAAARDPRYIVAGRGTTFYDDMATTISRALATANSAITRLRAAGL
jgi:UDP-galactopyranose mutase